MEPTGGPRPRPASPRRLLGRPPPRTCLGRAAPRRSRCRVPFASARRRLLPAAGSPGWRRTRPSLRLGEEPRAPAPHRLCRRAGPGRAALSPAPRGGAPRERADPNDRFVGARLRPSPRAAESLASYWRQEGGRRRAER